MTEQTGKIQTVLGLIDPDRLGVTSTHEHLFIDLQPIHSPPQESSARHLYYEQLSQDNIGYVRHYNLYNLDNVQLTEVDTAITEAALYKRHGGDAIVDATSIGIARDPVGLTRISRATDLHIIMGSSFYVDEAHPGNMANRSEKDLSEEIIRDITEGVGPHRVKSGIIGEVGCSWPLTENERKVLRASTYAQRVTGATMLIHPGRNELAPLEIIDIIDQSGGDLGRTIIGHLDRTVFERSTLTQIAQAGCYLEWDLFGRETSSYPMNPTIQMPSDAKRIEDIGWIISEGYQNKVVVAQDICTKDRLVTYGGHGYAYLPSQIAPRMRLEGYSEEYVHNILVDNPATALTFAPPE
ncbi:MAG: aryldialkylphosphatase [SAR202 cluster bacterium]|jgi:phosphotriesterase-related protein|nr:aryldialkylphosphatase [SAR202 cluster bacterium]